MSNSYRIDEVKKRSEIVKSLGLEDEMFCFSSTDGSEGHSQRKLFRQLASNFGYRVTDTHNNDGLPTQLNLDSESGYTCIKFDSTYSIIEIAHPPYEELNEVIAAVSVCRNQIASTAQKMGLRIDIRGYHSNNVIREDFIPKPTVIKTINRPDSRFPHFDRFYPSKVCSAQAHLLFNDQNIFKDLPKFYQVEPLVPTLFSTSYLNGVAHCYRLVLLQQAFESSYSFFGFPASLPASKEDYELRLTKAETCFRDYSLIVPRDFGTWEFRSACTQPSLLQLRTLLEMRIATAEAILSGKWAGLNYTHAEVKKIYEAACINPQCDEFTRYLDDLRRSGLFDLLRKSTGNDNISQLLLNVSKQLVPA